MVCVALFIVFAASAMVQTTPRPVNSGPVQATGPLPDLGKYIDVTYALNINFEYVASHTSRKYLIETMGSGVALFDYDNDGRLDILVVNGAPLSSTSPARFTPSTETMATALSTTRAIPLASA
jgi:hypothetical protein